MRALHHTRVLKRYIYAFLHKIKYIHDNTSVQAIQHIQKYSIIEISDRLNQTFDPYIESHFQLDPYT